MNIHNELNHGKGYAVFPIEDMENFKKLRETLIKKINISKIYEENIDYVRKEIAKMSKAEINRSMIQLLKSSNLSEMIINCCPKLIESLCSDLNNLFLDTYRIIEQSIITVKKPNALPKAKYAAYSMKKSRI